MLYTLLTVALSLTPLSSASSVPSSRDVSSIIRLPITAVNKASQLVSKRQDNVPLINEQGVWYLIQLSIGTPAQTQTVQLDTGSSDLWVNPECSTAGEGNEQLCDTLPPFKPGSSSTLINLDEPMNLSYGIGEVAGGYVTDAVAIGGATIKAQQFGIGETSQDLAAGILGISYGNEINGYPNVIDQLAAQEITQSRAFSLDLRSVDDPSGAIIFGGIDTKKYSGALEQRPIIPVPDTPDQFPRYWIYMTSAGITQPGKSSKVYPPSSSNPQGQPIFLDSGSTFCNFPTSLFNNLVADFPGATFDQTAEVYIVDCSLRSQAGTIDFGFGELTIHVPYSDFILQYSATTCVLGASETVDDIISLGDSFLRAAFVVYDQDNENLWLAPADDCGTNLVAIGKGVDAVPSIIGACGATTTSSTSTKKTAPPTTSTKKIEPPTTSTSSPLTTIPSTTTRLSSYPYTNTTSTTPTGSLSTVYTTTTYTISSCAPTVTNCPYGSTTTDTISLYTTYCPITAESSSPVVVTSAPTTAPTTASNPISTPSGTGATTPPPFTGGAGKVATNFVAAIVAGVLVVAML